MICNYVRHSERAGKKDKLNKRERKQKEERARREIERVGERRSWERRDQQTDRQIVKV